MLNLKQLNQLLEVPSLSLDEQRRSQLLNILLSGITILAGLALPIPFIFDGEPSEERLLIISILGVLVSMGIVFLISRYLSVRWASWIFLIFLILILTFSDVPEEVVRGRTLFIFTLPILIASVLLAPTSSFIVAGLISFVLVAVALKAGITPNLVGLIGFFSVALISWLAARSLEQALHDLQVTNEKLAHANDSLRQKIVERKEAEEKLARKARSLMRSNAELQQFAYVATHDLREPLRSVRTYTELLALRYEGQLDQKADKYINYIVKGANRMQTLITDLLTYSQVGGEELTLQTVDFNYLLDKVLTDLEMIIHTNKAIVTADSLPTLTVDSSQMTHLLQNLISNAIKFKREEPPRVHVSAEHQGDEWVFSVSDNGMGVEPQYAERIFVIFKRLHTKESYPGTGVGLAISKKVVENHNGRIWLESVVDQGTTFYFTLPFQKNMIINNELSTIESGAIN